ncbi:Thioesterase/thiol ester dehydrase-isomerase [Lophiostoma macrostomum CBS 122681]|uniref:Thioesterase/thiol ester dehydrase-isomerase n=1 Tax=Lophiostoma macrostomum CBS 122681 TaxID=1314788 RepID=A0A6A6SYD3_9PLEO|nr:Thioesterase/thiol ester dehydrase-isomerase [Lophiostoma macrostomum CBS 122681]
MTLESVTSNPTPAEPHHCVTIYSLTVEPFMCNQSGNLHGGAAATIFDTCTSISVTAISRDGFWDSGHVSRTLNCTYLRPVPGGEKIFVECEIVHAGKRLGLLKGVIKTKDGKVCVTCEHNKAAVGGSNL